MPASIATFPENKTAQALYRLQICITCHRHVLSVATRRHLRMRALITLCDAVFFTRCAYGERFYMFCSRGYRQTVPLGHLEDCTAILANAP